MDSVVIEEDEAEDAAETVEDEEASLPGVETEEDEEACAVEEIEVRPS